MLLLKIFFTTYQPSPDKGRLTCYELISYPFEIIIGLQKYGFSLNWQTISSFFWIYPVEKQEKTGSKECYIINAAMLIQFISKLTVLN